MLSFFYSAGLGPKFVAEPESRVVHSQKPNYPVNVIFPCSYHHVFPDVEMHVTWYRNGTVIQSGDAQYTIHPNGSLEISIREGIDATIEGLEYRCVVSNKFGSIISKPALIQYASEYGTVHVTLSCLRSKFFFFCFFFFFAICPFQEY